MPPPRKHIDPCGIEGHHIESLKKGITVVPASQSLASAIVDDVIVICTRCARTLDEIRATKEATPADS